MVTDKWMGERMGDRIEAVLMYVTGFLGWSPLDVRIVSDGMSRELRYMDQPVYRTWWQSRNYELVLEQEWFPRPTIMRAFEAAYYRWLREFERLEASKVAS